MVLVAGVLILVAEAVRFVGMSAAEMMVYLRSEVAGAVGYCALHKKPFVSFKIGKSNKEKRKLKKKKSSIRFAISRSTWSGSSSTVTSEDERRPKVITVVAKLPEMVKLKEVRRRRSKSLCISNHRKVSSGMPEPKEGSASASSCLSSGSGNAISSARSRDAIRTHKNRPSTPGPSEASKRKPVLGSGYMRRRAEAILKVLSSQGRASELRIRQLLGDSPSTSKALRILVNLEQVKRFGAGGRTDPYIYSIA